MLQPVNIQGKEATKGCANEDCNEILMCSTCHERKIFADRKKVGDDNMSDFLRDRSASSTSPPCQLPLERIHTYFKYVTSILYILHVHYNTRNITTRS